MHTDYLTWYKERMPLFHSPGHYSLMASSIEEPWDLIFSWAGMRGEGSLRELSTHPNPWGLPDLFDEISRAYDVPRDRIAVTQGATNALYLACKALLEPGDRVLVETPGYEPLWRTPMLCSAQVDFVTRPAHAYGIDPESLSRMIGAGTRLVIVTNLHNPSSAYLPPQAIHELFHAIKAKNPATRLLVDEIYLDFVADKQPPAATYDDDIITISSLTKVYGLSFLRCGWIVADRKTLDAVHRIQVYVDGIGSPLLEALGTLIFRNRDRLRNEILRHLDDNRKLLRDLTESLRLEGIISGKIPESGCVYFPRLEGFDAADELTGFLEERCLVHVVPGRFFGEPRHFRIGYGGSKETVMSGLGKFVQGVLDFLAQRT